nr:cyclin-dependent kinase F-4-like [Tanacetum cinerariifolium]
MIQHEKPFSETEIRNMCFQVFHGLAYMHQRGYFHRDFKPENLLMNKDIVKIADLGSSEADVMYKICSVLGTPTDSTWPRGLDLANNICYRFPDLPGVRFSDLLPDASPELVNLVATLLSWEPSYRPTAIEALQHPFFHSCYFIPPTARLQDTSFTLLDSIPLAFKLAMQRELMKTRSFKNCASSLETVDINEDLSHFLPKDLFV